MLPIKKSAAVFGCIFHLSGIPQAVEAGMSAEQTGAEEVLFSDYPNMLSLGFFSRRPTDLPGYAVLIDQKRIERSPARNLAELVDLNVPGFSSIVHETAGPVFGVRGVVVDSNAKTLVMMDGQHLNHRQHFGYANEMRVPLLGDIEKIEVVNGPGAIVHGSGAIGGFVNMYPKSGGDHPGLTVNTTLGAVDELVSTEVGYGAASGSDRSLYLYGGVVSAAGNLASNHWLHDRSNRVAENLTDYNFTLGADTRPNAFYGRNYKLGAYWKGGDLKLNWFLREENAQMNSTAYGPGTTINYLANPLMHTASMGIRPTYTLRLSDKEDVELLGSVLLAEQAFYANKRGARSYGERENHLEGKAVFKTQRLSRHAIALGSSYGTRKFEEKKKYFGSRPLSNRGDGMTGAWKELSVFGEDVVDLSSLLVFSLGGRYDTVKYDKFRDFQLPTVANTSLRTALSLNPQGNSTAKISYQEGFRYFDATYMHWFAHFNGRLAALGYADRIPNFKPETMNSVELNLSHRAPEKNMKIDLNTYYNTYKDTLTWHGFSPTNTAGLSPAAVAGVISSAGWMGSHINSPGEFSSGGIEAVVEWAPRPNFDARLQYGYSRPFDVDGDVRISLFTDDKDDWIRYPTHIVKLNLDYRPIPAIGITFIPQYSSRADRDRAKSLAALHPIYGKDRFSADVAVRWEPNDRFFLKASATNLFENDVPRQTFKQIPYMGAIGEEKRYVYLTTGLKF